MLTFLRATSQFVAFEDDPEAEAKAKAEAEAKAKAEAEAAAAAAAAAANNDKMFNQEQVNTMMAEERRKQQDKQRVMVTELETLKKSTSLTKKEKETLEKRLEDLQTQHMTTEEKARRAEETAEKKRTEEVGVLTEERNSWQIKHAKLVINTAIVGAASDNKAIQHEQITALIGPKTKLVEKLDEDGKPTGDYEPRVAFPDKDKDDKPVILNLTVSDAVKRMKELEQYGNLFEGGKVGGLGGTGSQTMGGNIDITEIAKKDPAKYRELRKKRETGSLT